MNKFSKLSVLAFLLSGLAAYETSHAQVRTPVTPPAVTPPAARPGGNWAVRGGYWGGGGFWGFNSPFNPLSPYSPYNPLSPISPYYNPYNAPLYASMYLYNPFWNRGLLSRNPRVQLQAWGMANLAATNVFSGAFYYDSMLQNQQAALNNYNAALTQQQAYSQLAYATNVSQQVAMAAMMQQQQLYLNSLANPYAQPARPAAPPSAPPPARSPSGFSTGTSSNYDPYANIMVSGAGPSTDSARPSGFGGDVRIIAPPTNAQQQAIRAYETLKRIQTVSSPGEIANGYALNILLNDIRKFIGRDAAMPPLKLDEETLREINVVKNGGNLAVIRNDGKISWPVALASYVLVPSEKTKLENTTIEAILSAAQNKIDGEKLISMGKQIDDIRAKLSQKINDIPTGDYIEAKQFLSGFEEARLALQKGEWTNHMKYQQFIARGRSVQELATWMVKEGNKFAPATPQDEGAYLAVHSALLAYDMQLQAQYAQVARE